MKTIALLTALAAALPAAAYADPVRTTDRDHDHGQARHEHYDRFNTSHWGTDHSRWTRLVAGNSATGRHEFAIGTQSRYHTFRLESLTGDPMISKIAINFADGSTQLVEVNTSLPAGAGEVIDLQGDQRHVARITVYADPHSRGAYAIFGT